MQEALIEYSENDVDHQDGHHQQHAQAAQRRLKRLRISLKGCGGGGRKGLPRQAVDFIYGVSNRGALFQVEGNSYRRKLPEMIDRKRAQGGSEFRNGVQRHKLSTWESRRSRRVNEERRDLVCVALKFRLQFENHPVLIIGRKDRGNLALAVRGIKRVFDLIDGHAVRRGRVAVNLHIDLGIADLQIAAHVRQAGQRAHLRGETLGRRRKAPGYSGSGS